MQSRNPFFDDVARVASGAMTTLGGVREEIENRVRERVERMAADLELVTREEHEAVRAMALKAREEQEALLERVDALETRLALLQSELESSAKPSGKRRAASTRKSDESDESDGEAAADDAS